MRCVSQKKSWLLTTRTCRPSRAHRRVRAPECPSDPLSGLRTTPPLPSAPGWERLAYPHGFTVQAVHSPPLPGGLKGGVAQAWVMRYRRSQSLSHVTSVSRAGTSAISPGPTFQLAQNCPLHPATQVASPSQVHGTQLGMRNQGPVNCYLA